VVHAVAKGALFFKRLFCCIVAVVAVWCVDAFGDIVLMGKYHILPCYKTEEQRPGANDTISAFFHNKAKVINKTLKIFLKRNNVVKCISSKKYLTRLHTYICFMKPAEINLKWAALQNRIATEFDNEKPDIKVVLFLIGVQELGQGPRKFSKRQKEELMHIANCKLFSKMGFYELEGLDQDGWPHWKLVKTVPNYTILEQEMLLKSLIIDYFEAEMEWEF